jgi:hypothetical protein
MSELTLPDAARRNTVKQLDRRNRGNLECKYMLFLVQISMQIHKPFLLIYSFAHLAFTKVCSILVNALPHHSIGQKHNEHPKFTPIKLATQLGDKEIIGFFFAGLYE